MSTMTASRQFLSLLLCLVIVFSVAALGSIFSVRAVPAWYHDLSRPAWTPPDWLFGPVWTLLYAMMAVAFWLVWRQESVAGTRFAITLFVIQLILNAAWTPIFFGAHLIGLATVEIVLLWCSILLCTIAFRRVKPLAALLMLPYLAWVSFASALNVSIWYLNRG